MPALWILLGTAIGTAGIMFVWWQFETGNILVGMLFVLSCVAFFGYRMVKTIQWWREEHPPALRKFFSWFLPVLLLIIAIPNSLQEYIEAYPVHREALVTITCRRADIEKTTPSMAGIRDCDGVDRGYSAS